MEAPSLRTEQPPAPLTHDRGGDSEELGLPCDSPVRENEIQEQSEWAASVIML